MTDPAPTRDEGGRWAPGCSGNPLGRPPRGMALAEALRRRLGAEVTLSNGQKATVAEAVALRLVALALAGDVAALRLLFERVEGRVPLAVDLLDGGEPRLVWLPLAPPSPPLAAGKEGVDDPVAGP